MEKPLQKEKARSCRRDKVCVGVVVSGSECYTMRLIQDYAALVFGVPMFKSTCRRLLHRALGTLSITS